LELGLDLLHLFMQLVATGRERKSRRLRLMADRNTVNIITDVVVVVVVIIVVTNVIAIVVVVTTLGIEMQRRMHL
jgi:hypothetical protein